MGRYTADETDERADGAEVDERADGADGADETEKKIDWPALVRDGADIARIVGPPAMLLLRGLFARRLCPACGAAADGAIEGEGAVV